MVIKDTATTYQEVLSCVLSKNPTPSTVTEAMRLNDLVEEEAQKILAEAERVTP